MCQVHEDGLSNILEKKPDFKVYRKCLRCDENSVIIVRCNEGLCKECFLEYFIHKFRATIGKNRIFERDELVLFAYSASSSSVGMLNLIVQGVSEEAKKKFTFKPVLIYIEDTALFNSDYSKEKRIEHLNLIKQSVEYSHFDVYYALLENSISRVESEKEPLFAKKIDELNFDDEKRAKFLSFIGNISNQTSREEMIKRLRMQLINTIAGDLQIQKVIFATNCTQLTVELLSNVSIGKGAHLSSETALEEKRSDKLIYLRPLREITAKEIAFYNHFVKIADLVHANNSSLLNLPNSTIYRLTEKFIVGLQNDYPSTVATIFRTSDKLTPLEDPNVKITPENCVLCERPLDTRVNLTLMSSAISDLEFSKKLMNSDQSECLPVEDSNNNLLSRYCYSCGIVVNDLTDQSNLPQFLGEQRRSMIKNQIKEFLLEDN